MEKSKLRQIIKQKRKLFLENGKLADISKKVSQNILNSEIFQKSQHIALYHPLELEIDIFEITKTKGKTFYLPKCINNELFFAKYDYNLKIGQFSIPEPKGDIINPDILDIIYIPSLCCNKNCYRLGWGKGFYDNFFYKNKIKAKKIIVSSCDFIENDLIEDEFDYKCDNIICENTTI